MEEELNSLQAILANTQKNLRNLKVQISKYTMSIDVPIDVLNAKRENEVTLRETQEKIDKLKVQFQKKGNTGKEDNVEPGKVADYLEDLDISKLWIGDELLDKIPIPIFAVDKNTKRQVLNWNKACVEYYKIPDAEHNQPRKWHVKDLFDQIRIHGSVGNEDVQKKTLEFYQNEIVDKLDLPEIGKHGFTVFLTKSEKEGDIDGFREFNRVTNVYYRTLKDNIFISMILTVPLDNLFKTENLKSFLNTLGS